MGSREERLFGLMDEISLKRKLNKEILDALTQALDIITEKVISSKDTTMYNKIISKDGVSVVISLKRTRIDPLLTFLVVDNDDESLEHHKNKNKIDILLNAIKDSIKMFTKQNRFGIFIPIVKLRYDTDSDKVNCVIDFDVYKFYINYRIKKSFLGKIFPFLAYNELTERRGER